MRTAYRPKGNFLSFMACGLVLFGFSVASPAQKPQSRIAGEISSSSRVAIPESQSPMTKLTQDTGRLASNTPLGGMKLIFNRSAAQEADLQALIAAQQNPSSPQYHVWLTPDQFAARFGMSDADLAKAQAWLQQQGFTVDAIARSKNSITFSGTSGQAESAFGVELHNYRSNDGTTHFAPAGNISLPAALSSVVQAVTNLSSFRPRSHMVVKRGGQPAPTPNFTSAQTGNHYLTPGDVDTIYDITAAHNAGFTGVGQSIAIVGQSAVVQSDISNFQSAAGLTAKAPVMFLVPNSGAATVYSGDEAESDLDLEYSGATAPGATIYFVYVGSNENDSVTDAIQSAVDNDIAPIISTSYGLCETELAQSDYTAENGILAQAAAQGQTVIAAAGDDGSTDCYVGTVSDSTPTQAQQEALAVDFPGSSQYVTAMGGTEFSAADIATTNTTYWASANGNDLVSSALSYIPEQVWNDDSSSVSNAEEAISAGGGGISTLTPRPTWQVGSGISSGNFRLMPDISLAASPSNPGYLYCSSDPDAWSSTSQVASCNSGFRDSSSQLLTVAGGTSFTVPIFAGMVAMLNQATNSTGQGVVGPMLYGLAANPTTYASAFHDITVGTNACTAGSSYCSTAGASEYAATTGYDEASGLGSVDFANLLAAWKASTTTGASALVSSTTTVTAATTAPAASASDVVTITVASGSSASTTPPSGTVTLTVDGTAIAPLALTNGVANYTFSSATVGSHSIKASYSGDSTYAASTGSLSLNVGGPPPNSSFALTATNITVASGGSTGTSTITVTPNLGYIGTIAWSVSSTSTLSNVCVSIPNTTVTGAAPTTATLTVGVTSAVCSSANVVPAKNGAKMVALKASTVATRGQAPVQPASPGTKAGIALAGLLFFGLCGSRSRKLKLFLALGVISVATLSTFGCGSSSSTSGGSGSTTTTPGGSYTLTVTGTDTSATAQTASVNLTLTVQ